MKTIVCFEFDTLYNPDQVEVIVVVHEEAVFKEQFPHMLAQSLV